MVIPDYWKSSAITYLRLLSKVPLLTPVPLLPPSRVLVVEAL
jgi:hypothetical protein